MLQPVVSGRGAVSSLSDEQLLQARTGSLLDLSGLRAIMRRRSRVAIGAFGATIFAVLLYVLFVPPKYLATSVILSEPRQERIVQSEAVLPGIGSDVAAVESQVELLNSPELIRRVMEKLGLFYDPEFAEGSFLTQLKESIFGSKPK